MMVLPNIKDIKNWSPEIEKQITEAWKKEEKYKFNTKTKKRIYSIDTPPPYVNTPVHIGQTVTYCYMDFFARYKRMKGFEVIFPLGLDRNGLPIEIAAEKKFNVSPFIVGKEKFIEYCEKVLSEASTETIDTFAKLGISFTSYKQGGHIGSVYLTDSPEYRSITQSTFIELYKKGLIYEDKRVSNWDPKLRTTIADSEIEYKDIPSNFNDIEWKVKETGEEIVIGTTRPELICTCGMVIFNPEDKRYKKLKGKTAVSPIFGKEIPIRSHPLAEIDKGTGLVMMCSAGDLSDIQFFREMKIKPTIAINQDGTMNEHAGLLKGLKVKEARQKILEKLKNDGLLIKQEQISHRTPISERSGAEIEFIEMPEFYLKQLEFKKDIEKIAKKIDFYPTESKKILDDWIEKISIDWPISRRRFYATPIPLWQSNDGKTALPPAGKYYVPWKESPPKDSEVFKDNKIVGKVKDYPKEVWKGEDRVFDTWMDSSISELVILKYKVDNDFFKKAYPASLRPQGKEIIRTWLYYPILRGNLETGKPAFKDVWINQHIVDEKGKKMSKSLGNVVNPQDLLKEFGGEAIRIWASTEGNLAKQDLKCSKDKIRAETKTINKLLNLTKFIFQFPRPKKVKLTSLDQLFIDYLEDLTSFADENYEQYNFYNPALKLRQFLWDVFASHYLEIVKNRAYNQENKFSNNEQESAQYALYYLLERMLILLHPIIPQITSVILNDLDVKEIQFPTAEKGKSDLSLIDKIMAFNSEVWKLKREKNISLRDSISGIKIPKELSSFESDLKACHNLL